MPGRVTVVGVGPAGPDLITPAAREALSAHPRQRTFVRTTRHPAMEELAGAAAMDDLYESGSTFDEVYEAIVDRLVTAAADGDVVYAVPGSPLVLERTVELLRRESSEGAIELRVVPGMSFLDLAWERLGIDPVDQGVRLVDGLRFASAAAGSMGPLLVAHCHNRSVLSDVKLSVDEDPGRVTVLQRLGSADEKVFEVGWDDLDRTVDADHLTSLYVPALAEAVGAAFVDLAELMRDLRERCPWDREQTHASLRRHLLEEAHETLEALDARAEVDDAEPDPDLDEHLAEELGDLLFQVFFHARVAAERGAFTVTDVARGIHDKLVVRHPHVFGDVQADDIESVLGSWETNKRREKGRTSALEGVPAGLPALMLASKLVRRASSSPVVDYPDAPWFDNSLAGRVVLPSQLSERELGDLLFATVEIAAALDLDPETALRQATVRFTERFGAAERGAPPTGPNRP